jgi:uncharacterized protein YaaN involved in tellurite resistance
LTVKESQAAADAMREKVDGASDLFLHELMRMESDILQMTKLVKNLYARQELSLINAKSILDKKDQSVNLQDDLNMIKTQVISLWKDEMVQYAVMIVHQQCSNFAEIVHRSTQRIIVSNAKMSHDNGIAIAKAGTTLVITTETLDKVRALEAAKISAIVDIRNKGIEGWRQDTQKVTQDRQKREMLARDVPNRLAMDTDSSSETAARHWWQRGK